MRTLSFKVSNLHNSVVTLQSFINNFFHWTTERKESVTVGGVFHPDVGALVYREEIEETVITPEEGSEFQTKKIKRVTSETRRLGEAPKPLKKKSQKQPLLEAIDGGQAKAWSDGTSQVEANPLYSSSDYVTDFSNPLYTNRQSVAEEVAATTSTHMGTDDMLPLIGDSADGRGAKGKLKQSSDDLQDADVLY